jgi:hypothetical protein
VKTDAESSDLFKIRCPAILVLERVQLTAAEK